MKTTKLLLAVLLFFSLQSQGQITLQHNFNVSGHTYLSQDVQEIYLANAGSKYVWWNEGDSLKFYNLNLSPYKTVIIPGGTNIYSVTWISVGLFNTDTTHIAYMVEYGTLDSLKIYDESGNTLLNIDSTEQLYEQVGFTGVATPAIFPTDSGTYMILVQSNLTNFTPSSYLLYKLPGSLPCIPGCNGKYFTSSPQLENKNYSLRSYPNPAVSYTDIYYTLPDGVNEAEIIIYDLAGKEIKQFKIDNRTDHLHLTTEHLHAGIYLYRLVDGQKGVAAKKMVVVK